MKEYIDTFKKFLLSLLENLSTDSKGELIHWDFIDAKNAQHKTASSERTFNLEMKIRRDIEKLSNDSFYFAI